MAFVPTCTGSAAALLPPVLNTVQQTAMLTPWKSFRRELAGKGDEDRGFGAEGMSVLSWVCHVVHYSVVNAHGHPLADGASSSVN